MESLWNEIQRIAPDADDDSFGVRLSFNSDEKVLAVGAFLEDLSTDGVDSIANNSLTDSGAAYVYRENAGVWIREAYLKATNPGSDDRFGYNIIITGDGTMVAVGSNNEDSTSAGVDSIAEDDGNADDSGAYYGFGRVGNGWAQMAYVKSPQTREVDEFGSGPLSADDSGAIYIYDLSEVIP